MSNLALVDKEFKTILKKKNNINGVYNVGFGKPNKVKDVIKLIQKNLK